MDRMRRTKIVATLGPATDAPDVLENLILAGMDLARLNFSHGTAEDHIQRVKLIRELSKKHEKEIGILADLQGPKIRIAKFKEQSIELDIGQEFVLDADLDPEQGTKNTVGIDYKDLPKDVNEGDTLLLDDGRLVFEVTKVQGQKIICNVTVGGTLSCNKGINRLGGGLSAEALTEKDHQDLKTAVAFGADYIAISFPRCAADVKQARALIEAEKGTASIVAKIERHEAMEDLDAIIEASDAVMVARGDLGVEIGDADLPWAQKHIIGRARALDKTVITATQMMESMITNSIPTRAEVFDVANAVLDTTDAVMLSAETAAGDHPAKVVESMARICLGAEAHRSTQVSGHRLECEFERIDEAVAMATMYTANHLKIKAIIALTESGTTPLLMSRIRSGIPVFALSRHIETQRKLTLYRGVYPLAFDITKLKRDEVNRKAVEVLEKRGLVKAGDRVIITKGDSQGIHGGTNAMKIVRVGEVA